MKPLLQPTICKFVRAALAVIVASAPAIASPYCIFAQKAGAAPEVIAAERSAPPKPQPAFVTVESASRQPGVEGNHNSKDEQQIDAPHPQTGSITGTVTDVNNDPVPDANILIESRAPDYSRTTVANDSGFFELGDLQPEVAYHLTISATGFTRWASAVIVLSPGQRLLLTGIKLQIEELTTSITVTPLSSAQLAQLALEQVKIEEQQRVFGVIPNFYVVYDPNAVALTTKLKFRLALRESLDPIFFLGAGFRAGVNQATRNPDYVLGAKGYGQRLGAVYADNATNSLVGDAILPSLLHQDPRYFYQGTGTIKSRALHAISHTFVTKGDNGRLQPNYSSIGGDMISGAISNLYYPVTNRGPGLVFQNTLINSGERMLGSLLEEFVLPRFVKKQQQSSSAVDQK